MALRPHAFNLNRSCLPTLGRSTKGTGSPVGKCFVFRLAKWQASNSLWVPMCSPNEAGRHDLNGRKDAQRQGRNPPPARTTCKQGLSGTATPAWLIQHSTKIPRKSASTLFGLRTPGMRPYVQRPSRKWRHTSRSGCSILRGIPKQQGTKLVSQVHVPEDYMKQNIGVTNKLVCLHIYVYVCIYILYIYICICVHVYIHIFTLYTNYIIYIYIYICTYTCAAIRHMDHLKGSDVLGGD